MMTLFSQERLDQFKYNEALAEGIGIGEAKGREEGIGIGEARGELNMLASLVRNKLLSKDIAASQLGITVEEFDKRYKESGITVC